MDRYDEKKDRTDELVTGRDPREERDLVREHEDARERALAGEEARGAEDEPAREGDVLGLSDTVVPKGPGDPSTEHDPQSVAQRRARALSDETPATEPADPSNQGGATGIDMGSGGQSTLLRRPKSS